MLIFLNNNAVNKNTGEENNVILLSIIKMVCSWYLIYFYLILIGLQPQNY